MNGSFQVLLGRDYGDHNRHKEMTLPAVEFLRRFAMLIVPPRFTRVRYFGFLAKGVRTPNVEKARKQGTMIRGRDVDPTQPRTWFDSS